MPISPEDQRLLAKLYPPFAVRVVETLSTIEYMYGRKMRLTSGLRTFEEQKILYAQGRTAPGGIITSAEPGESLHNYGLAVDACFRGLDPYLEKTSFGDLLWRAYGREGKKLGLTWGGDFTRLVDKPHLELTLGLSLQKIKELYAEGGVLRVWSHLDTLLPKLPTLPGEKKGPLV